MAGVPCGWSAATLIAGVACADGDTPGAWTCTDLKGITYDLVPVDDRGTLAFFSTNAATDMRNSCYCKKLCC